MGQLIAAGSQIGPYPCKYLIWLGFPFKNTVNERMDIGNLKIMKQMLQKSFWHPGIIVLYLCKTPCICMFMYVQSFGDWPMISKPLSYGHGQGKCKMCSSFSTLASFSDSDFAEDAWQIADRTNDWDWRGEVLVPPKWSKQISVCNDQKGIICKNPCISKWCVDVEAGSS